MNIDKGSLNSNGWLEIENVFCEKEIKIIAESIGILIPHPGGEVVATITPNDGAGAVTGTFSNRFGYESFPFHTDTAFWSIPARYVVMGIFEQSKCNTRLVSVKEILGNMSDSVLSCMESATYMVNTIEDYKYTSLLINSGNKRGFRYDPSCMQPINKSAKVFQQALPDAIASCQENIIKWTGNKAVIIDNWNMLHGREVVHELDYNRKLARVYAR